MKTTILHSNCPWTTTKNTTMLRKNISGLSLWGGLVCVGIFSFNYVVDEVVGPCQACMTLPSLPHRLCSWRPCLSSGQGLLPQDFPKGLVEAVSDSDIHPPKIIKYEFPLLGGIFFPRIYEFQEKWPVSFHRPRWARTRIWAALTPRLACAQSMGKSSVSGGLLHPRPFFILCNARDLLSLASVPNSLD